MNPKDIYIRGIGIVSGLGLTVEEHRDAFAQGRSGMGPVSLFDTPLQVPVSEVKASREQLCQWLGLPVRSSWSRTALLGFWAVRKAAEDAGLDVRSPRVGLVSSTSVGGMDLSEHFFRQGGGDPLRGSLRNIVSHDCGDSTSRIAMQMGFGGYVTTLSTACSSAANAIMFGARLIREGLMDAVVAGGVDALCAFTLNGFHSLMILDKNHCRPFDVSRSGLNLGEGAGFVVLTSDSRQARARLAGFANANDAYHQTASSPEGDGPYLSMSRALAMSGLSPSQIDYINVHGTGTENNDLSEGRAMKRLFGEQVPLFSSTKSFTGHTLGAAGGIEAVLSVLSVERGWIYPNLNFAQSDPAIGLAPGTEFRTDLPVRSVLSNSFGFGGNDSTLIFSRE